MRKIEAVRCRTTGLRRLFAGELGWESCCSIKQPQSWIPVVWVAQNPTGKRSPGGVDDESLCTWASWAQRLVLDKLTTDFGAAGRRTSDLETRTSFCQCKRRFNEGKAIPSKHQPRLLRNGGCAARLVPMRTMLVGGSFWALLGLNLTFPAAETRFRSEPCRRQRACLPTGYKTLACSPLESSTRVTLQGLLPFNDGFSRS